MGFFSELEVAAGGALHVRVVVEMDHEWAGAARAEASLGARPETHFVQARPPLRPKTSPKTFLSPKTVLSPKTFLPALPTCRVAFEPFGKHPQRLHRKSRFLSPAL